MIDRCTPTDCLQWCLNRDHGPVSKTYNRSHKSAYRRNSRMSITCILVSIQSDLGHAHLHCSIRCMFPKSWPDRWIGSCGTVSMSSFHWSNLHRKTHDKSPFQLESLPLKSSLSKRPRSFPPSLLYFSWNTVLSVKNCKPGWFITTSGEKAGVEL